MARIDQATLLPKPVGVTQRDLVVMSADEVDAYLRLPHALTVSTIKPSGEIHSVAMWYAYLDGLVFMEAKQKSQKVRNMLRDPRVTVLAHSGAVYSELQGVMLAGAAEVIVDDDAVMRRIVTDVFRRYHGIDEPDESVVGPLLRNRVAIKVVPTTVASWDHRKLA